MSPFKKIYADLLAHEDKKRAESDKKYHKYDGYRSFGIKASELTNICKSHKAAIQGLSCAEALALATELYEKEIEETVMIGNFVLELKLDCLKKQHFAFLDRALGYFHSWSTVDDFCVSVLQPLLLKHPMPTLTLLKKWNRSKNMWKRRASVVAFVRKIGESGQHTDQALALCENLIQDKEDLVQKGVGWCLKDLMRGDKKRVFEYVQKLRRHSVSSTITLYAARDLKGTERSLMLQK